MLSPKPKYSRAIKRRARAYVNFINNRTEPPEESSTEITVLMEHPGLLESDDDDSVDDTPYALPDEDNYFVGFGSPSDGASSTEAQYPQPEPSGRATPNFFGTAYMYHNRCAPAPPTIPPQSGPSGRATPDFLRTPGYYPDTNDSKSPSPPKDLDPYFFGNSESQCAPRSTTPEGDHERRSHSPNHPSNVQRSQQADKDPELEHRTGVQNPPRNPFSSVLDSGYATYGSDGSATRSASAPSWRLSRTSDIQIPTHSPFEPEYERGTSRLFGPLESLFQAWSAGAQSRQTAVNSRPDSKHSDGITPSSADPNPINLPSWTVQNGSGRQAVSNDKHNDSENVNSMALPIRFKEDKNMGHETRTIEQEHDAEFISRTSYQCAKLDNYRSNTNKTCSSSCLNTSPCARCFSIKAKHIQHSDNGTRLPLKGPEIEGGQIYRAEQEIRNKNEVSQNTAVGDATHMSPAQESSCTEKNTSLSVDESSEHGPRSGQPDLGRLYPHSAASRAVATPLPEDSFSPTNTNTYGEMQPPTTMPNNSESVGGREDGKPESNDTAVPDSLPDLEPASSNEDDAMYDVELSGNNPSGNSDDDDWLAVARRMEDDDAVIFARRFFSSWESPRAELLELVLQRLGPQRAMRIVTGRTQTEQLNTEQNEEQEEHREEDGEIDEAGDGWVAVRETER